MTAHNDEYPDFGLTPEERRRAVFTHYYERPGMDGEHGEIWCYTDRFSYRTGETATFFVSSTAATFGIEIVRDGAVETPLFSRRNVAARWQDTPDQCSVEGCGWEATFELPLPSDWPSGAYRVTLRSEGHGGKAIVSHHLFVIAPHAGRKAGRVLLVASTGTWTAYNT